MSHNKHKKPGPVHPGKNAGGSYQVRDWERLNPKPGQWYRMKSAFNHPLDGRERPWRKGQCISVNRRHRTFTLQYYTPDLQRPLFTETFRYIPAQD